MGRRSVLRLVAAFAVGLASLAAPAVASAHPLGNFTINHYAELTIGTDRVDVDVVIDMAEIPTFQERQTMDTDEDGSVSDEEVAGWAPGACRRLAPSLHLSRDAADLALVAGSSAASFANGAGGLSTLRLECGFSASLATPLSAPTTFRFHDDSYAERIGWREIVATAHGTILDTHGLPAVSPSDRLTAYPADQIATPLDIRSATIGARLDPAAAAPVASDPLPAPALEAPAAPVTAAPGAVPGGVAGAVPGGVAAELPAIFRATDLTAIVVLGSIATAVAIGALHALTPGHGKTLMAAYLVGTRGTAVHAVGLGLSVAVSHTLGILALALLVVGAGSALPPDVVYRVTPVIAGVSIVAIGGWMLIAEVRRRTRGARLARDHAHEHEDEHDHHHGANGAGVHSHGGAAHSHLPPGGRTLTWRGLFVLGLAGGLVPSTSALIILLGSIAAGRPAFGLVLVAAFGLGMAAVMTGVGLAMIVARTRLDRMPSRSSLGRLAAAAPLVASVAVLVLGSFLTWQAVTGAPIL